MEMKAIYANNIRTLIAKANSYGIRKEDIVNLVETDNQYILIYYGAAEE